MRLVRKPPDRITEITNLDKKPQNVEYDWDILRPGQPVPLTSLLEIDLSEYDS